MRVEVFFACLIQAGLALQQPRPSLSKLNAATLQQPPAPDVTGATGPVGWECDDEANCKEVPACDDEACRTSLDVRIHGSWYDLSGTSLVPEWPILSPRYCDSI